MELYKRERKPSMARGGYKECNAVQPNCPMKSHSPAGSAGRWDVSPPFPDTRLDACNLPPPNQSASLTIESKWTRQLERPTYEIDVNLSLPDRLHELRVWLDQPYPTDSLT